MWLILHYFSKKLDEGREDVYGRPIVPITPGRSFSAANWSGFMSGRDIKGTDFYWKFYLSLEIKTPAVFPCCLLFLVLRADLLLHILKIEFNHLKKGSENDRQKRDGKLWFGRVFGLKSRNCIFELAAQIFSVFKCRRKTMFCHLERTEDGETAWLTGSRSKWPF